MLSDACGVEAMKKSSILIGKNGSNRARMSKSQMKTMFINFFDINGSVHFAFIQQGQTVNLPCYVEILKLLLATVSRRSLHFGLTIGFPTMAMPQLTRRSVNQFLAQTSITD
jgi:hypothetical protein